MEVVLQQLGVVVAHFFEMRNDPALVDRVAVKPARQLVVNAAARHAFERVRVEFLGPHVVVPRGTVDQQVQRGRMRKLRRVAEAAIPRVVGFQRGVDNRGDDCRRKIRVLPPQRFGL